jgi:hypothetical protein
MLKSQLAKSEMRLLVKISQGIVSCMRSKKKKSDVSVVALTPASFIEDFRFAQFLQFRDNALH